MNVEPPERAEWDFADVPADERFVCMLYELTRESPTIRWKAAEAWNNCSEQLAAKGKRDWPPFRPSVHDFLANNAQAEYLAYANLGFVEFQKFPWTKLLKEHREWILPLVFCWYVKERLTMPDDLPVRAHAYNGLTIDGIEVINANLPVPPSGECGFCLTVDLASEDPDLIEAFMQHVRAMRQMQGLPAEMKGASKKGRKTIFQDPKAMLQKIGLMRLDAVLGPVAALKAVKGIDKSKPDSNPSETVNDAKSFVVRAMHHYMVLPKGELPYNYRHPQSKPI